jgi:predicted TIM-barrel fold metal-dependent hydrolase
VDVRIFDEPKIDCHVHVLDPARFPYAADTHYAPGGQELGTPAQLAAVMQAYGTRHALLVGPNSGYGLDNACLLDTLARHPDRYRGIAVVRNDTSIDTLRALKAQGVVGVAWNVTHYGVDYYDDAEPLLDKLATLDMFVDIQVEHDQLVHMLPMLAASDARVLVDHCGRPTVADGIDQPGFRAVLALVDAYSLDACLWASDWPYLRAPERVDYGVLLDVVLRLFPDAAQRRKMLWDTPRAAFGFGP